MCCDDKEARMLFLLPLLFLRGMGGKPIDFFRAARVGKSFKARQQRMLGVVWCCAALQTCALVLRYPPQRKGREYQGDVTTPLLGGAKPVRVHTYAHTRQSAQLPEKGRLGSQQTRCRTQVHTCGHARTPCMDTDSRQQ